MESLYKKIPTNMRLFVEFMGGNTSPITRDDFTSEEINEIRNRVYAAKERNSIREEELKAEMVSMEEDVKKNGPDGFYGWENGKYKTSEEYLEKLSKKLASFENTRGKTSVSYNRDDSGTPTQDAGIFGAFGASMKSPAYNIETSLGRFNAYDTPKGIRIKDTYNWSKPGKPVSVKDFLYYGAQNIGSPEKLGNLVARTFFRGKERDIDFEIKGK
jgi:hypothetical protein